MYEHLDDWTTSGPNRAPCHRVRGNVFRQWECRAMSRTSLPVRTTLTEVLVGLVT